MFMTKLFDSRLKKDNTAGASKSVIIIRDSFYHIIISASNTWMLKHHISRIGTHGERTRRCVGRHR